jgi:hypothetical protein
MHSGNIGSYAPIYNANGNVLIGTTNDNGHKLQVNGSTHSQYYNTGWGKEGNLPYTGWNWYRVAVGSTYGVNIILSIGKNFYHIGPDSAVFSISIGYDASASAITLLSKNHGYQNFSSIRVVTLSSSSYAIEVYLYNSIANADTWYVSGISMGDWVFQAPVLSDGGGTVTGQLGMDYSTTIATNGNAVISGNISASGQSDVAIYTSSTPSTASANSTGLFRWGVFDEKTGGFKSQFGGDNCEWQIIDRQWSKALFSFSSSGNFYASGGITARYASDRRLKEDIKTISTEVALQTIMALNPITFRWNAKATELCSWLNGESQGFIAQEYEALIPNSGSEMWGEYRGIDYNRAIPYIVAVEQNHETRIKQLEEELQTLKRKCYGNR